MEECAVDRTQWTVTCRHHAGSSQAANLAPDSPVRLALSSYCTEEKFKEAGQWAEADNIKVFWIPIQSSLLLLATQIKSKTQKAGSNLGAVTSLSKVWHLQDPLSPAEPDQK